MERREWAGTAYAIRAFELSAGGGVLTRRSKIVSDSFDTTLRLWETSTGHLRTFAGHSDAAIALASSPDGRRIVSGSYDGTLSWRRRDRRDRARAIC
ncbi:hypothetical protein IVB31_32745 [Bradyrhizobium sp. 21]|nr:hypothetical protein [Bradyrhizobium sp. 21]